MILQRFKHIRATLNNYLKWIKVADAQVSANFPSPQVRVDAGGHHYAEDVPLLLDEIDKLQTINLQLEEEENEQRTG